MWEGGRASRVSVYMSTGSSDIFSTSRNTERPTNMSLSHTDSSSNSFSSHTPGLNSSPTVFKDSLHNSSVSHACLHQAFDSALQCFWLQLSFWFTSLSLVQVSLLLHHWTSACLLTVTLLIVLELFGCGTIKKLNLQLSKRIVSQVTQFQLSFQQDLSL